MSRVSDLVAPGRRAVRQNWRPFLAIQAGALAVVLAYYNVPAVTNVIDAAGVWRDAGGFLFAAAASALAGAVLPEFAKALTQRGYRVGGRGGEVTFLFLLFAVNGVVVDAFYRFLAWLFGTGTDPATALSKMAFDMLVFSPFLAVPLVMLTFEWRRSAYSRRVLDVVRSHGLVGWYGRRVLPVMLPNWVFWGPMTLMIYSMPAGLQIVMFAAALGAWSLILVFIGNDPPTTPPPDDVPEARLEPGVLAVGA